LHGDVARKQLTNEFSYSTLRRPMPTATPTRVDLIGEPDRVRLALSPVRRDLLERLREPASATQLAAELGLSRQRINYHLRALERAGMLDLVEERPRRGFTERVLAARADAFVVDPGVMGSRASIEAQDRYAAEHLIGAASDVVRDVVRMQAAAQAEGTRLLTFTIEADVRFAAPADVERFCERLAELVADTAAAHGTTAGGRSYRLVLGGHPAPSTTEEPDARS
jgi:DNA-binding transcriptional ArsR family regulator